MDPNQEEGLHFYAPVIWTLFSLIRLNPGKEACVVQSSKLIQGFKEYVVKLDSYFLPLPSGVISSGEEQHLNLITIIGDAPRRTPPNEADSIMCLLDMLFSRASCKASDPWKRELPSPVERPKAIRIAFVVATVLLPSALAAGPNATSSRHENATPESPSLEEAMWEDCRFVASTENYVVIVAFAVIFCLSVVGNAVVIVVIVQQRTMRSVTNLYLLNLAITDLLLSVVCMPPTLVSSVVYCWMFGDLMCKVLAYLQRESTLEEKYKRTNRPTKKPQSVKNLNELVLFDSFPPQKSDFQTRNPKRPQNSTVYIF
uniref:G_PROTEIN_RECEP_F1_2 domain-containing protein n=1 Tax=Steinernema glaseri TaxID=37863 RepID=A0A1I7Z582_9BILA